MKTLKSYACGEWYEADSGFAALHDPCNEEAIAQASAQGLDRAAALEFARLAGSLALRSMSFVERADLLMGMSKALHAHRDELIDLSIRNTGCTRKDAKFDLDGATGTLSFYSYLARDLGEGRVRLDGEGVALGRSAKFWGQHVGVPRQGVAVLVNAFNFPAWGFAEKTACAFAAGMPVCIKPATSTAMVTERCVEILVESGLLPPGALSLLCGEAGDLIDHLGAQDVLAFTGSAQTAMKLRSRPNLLEHSTRVNIEADSLNAAVLAPDVEAGSETWDLFVREVVREMTQKTGQKCTAVRRIFVPEERLDEVQETLLSFLQDFVTGDPRDESVTMGPLVSQAQLDDAVLGVKELAAEAEIVFGSGERCDGVGAEPGKGYFFAPVLLRAADAETLDVVHTREVFGPVATLVPYDGTPESVSPLLGLGGGTLVTSAYSDDVNWARGLVEGSGAWTGRLYLGSEKMAAMATGSGLTLPQSIHGGPGRAGGGQELGGSYGLDLYLQRVALQGSRAMLTRILEPAKEPAS
jgi:oxepin-CoA hydrolase/3-oxo-5,6-dehydrosuberyl-CoA semialdehyde dehydrogenase